MSEIKHKNIEIKTEDGDTLVVINSHGGPRLTQNRQHKGSLWQYGREDVTFDGPCPYASFLTRNMQVQGMPLVDRQQRRKLGDAVAPPL